MEGGIELGWLKDRIILNVDYYRNRTDNQLVQYTLPSIDGFTAIQANLPATVQNTGVEIELNTINIKKKNFSWSSSINISIPRNKLVSFPNLANSNYKNTYVVGKPLFIRSNFHYTGIDQQTGFFTFEDVNKDGKIDANDRQFLKQVAQDYFGGFLNSFTYKGLQLDIFLQFVKQTGNNYIASGFGYPGFMDANQPTYALSRWTKPNDVATIQKISQGGIGSSLTAMSNYLSSDAIISDASFVRLKNISLSYNFPKIWQNKAHLKNARVYVQCQNLFTITKFKGIDPETQGKSLPPLRMITAGMQLGL
jgi:hypothetical protein